ncbi:MAG: histidine kinase [Cytophagales bacterium]|nr:MAG: histidine kinase [Cytophagales bacterium]
MNNKMKDTHQESDLVQSVLDGVSVSIAVLEAVRPSRNGSISDFRVVRANQVFTENICWATSECTGRLLSEIYAPVRESGLLSRCLLGVELNQRQDFEMPFTVAGRSGWFQVSVTPKGEQVILVMTDITETKQTLLSHHYQAELLQSISDSTPAGLVLWEAIRDDSPARTILDFRYRITNQMNTLVTGYSSESLVGQGLFSLFPRFKGTELETILRDVIETGRPAGMVFPYYTERPDGWYNAQFSRVGDGVLMTFMDVTEAHKAQLDQKRQHQALEMANLELRRSNDNLQQFAYIASHDLQEPLRKIQSFGDLLQGEHGLGMDEVGKDMVSRMQASAQRMSMLIRDLLNYSRLSTHRQPFERVSLDVLVAEVLDDLYTPTNESGAVITVDALLELDGDRRQLRQLFQNLISNALKFRRPGHVPQIRVLAQTVTTETLPAQVVAGLELYNDGPLKPDQLFHQISIADTGIGFDEKYLDRIFQVFQRLHGRTNYPGTGVGLAICRKVAENHRGLLTATSQPGVGSTFFVYLPI